MFIVLSHLFFAFAFLVNIEEAEMKKRKNRQQYDQRPATNNTQGTGEKGVKKATDDYHYDKFKKQFRRY